MGAPLAPEPKWMSEATFTLNSPCSPKMSTGPLRTQRARGAGVRMHTRNELSWGRLGQ